MHQYEHRRQDQYTFSFSLYCAMSYLLLGLKKFGQGEKNRTPSTAPQTPRAAFTPHPVNLARPTGFEPALSCLEDRRIIHYATDGRVSY